MHDSLAGKTALITAAAGGLGSAIATGLAQNGATVAVTDIREDAISELAEAIRGKGGRAWDGVCDVTCMEAVETTVQRVVSEVGHIDILVNVAGCATLSPILEMSKDDFDRTIASCLGGAFLVSKAVGRVMVEAGTGGSIVHISSIAGSRALGRGTGAYAAAKAGLEALVRELAVEWAPCDIRVNAVAPCQFRTRGLEQVLDDPRFGGREVLAPKMLGHIPVGRFGEVEDIVGPCLFLASDAASMVTGHVLAVDGGFLAQ